MTNASLQDGVFDCGPDVLKELDISCDDLFDRSQPEGEQDNTKLLPIARVASCTAQWWTHALLLRWIFSVIIWVFLNIFRVVFTSGLTRILWNYLNTGQFTYLATCRPDGSHTYNEDDLAERVAIMLSRMRVVGFFLCALACLTQVPWMYAMSYFVQDLAGIPT